MLKLLTQPETHKTAITHRYASSSAIDAECAKCGLEWLTSDESDELAALHHPRRRQEWLRSRWLAKQLITNASPVQHELSEIAILREGESRRPGVWINGESQPWSLSMSHSARGVLAGFCYAPETKVGVDLTDRVPLSSSFIQLWFTVAEIAWLKQQTSPFLANTIWATKEAIFKACSRGEGFDPRQIEVLRDRTRYRGESVNARMQQRIVDGQIAVIVTVRNPTT